MQAKPRDIQGDLYSVRLDFLCNETHPLVRLSKATDWSHYDETLQAIQRRPEAAC